MLAITLLFLAQQGPAIPPDSYADSATAHVVAQARAARDRNERLVTAYTANVSQRMGAGLRALSRDRMLYRQEIAARIEWRRDARSVIHVTGFREGIPVAQRQDRVPRDVDASVRWLAVDPARDYLSLMVEDGDGNDDGFVYPLRAGGEHDYRYALGDTTRIELPTGRTVRLLQVMVTPRRADWQLMAGSLWFDADTWGLVRAVFRPARPYEFRRDADPEDTEDVPSFVNGTGEIKSITMEYGLYEDRWWMLRYVALDGVGSVGRWLDVPIKFERVYSDYEVEGGTPPDPESTFVPAGGRNQRRPREEPAVPLTREQRRQRADSLARAIEACVTARETARTTQPAPGNLERDPRRGWNSSCWREVRGDTALAVVIPDDVESLLTSPTLGKPILQMGDLIIEEEIRGLADAIKQLPAAPLGRRIEVPTGLSSLLRIARYNRVEGLSVGPRATASLGRAAFDLEGRIGVADWKPNFEAGAALLGRSTRVRLGGYQRLAVANPDTRALGPLNSLSALLLQRDDGEYYRTTGVELTGQNTVSGWVTWRLYAQRERPAVTETSASLPHLFNSARHFRPNILADSANQFGGAVGFRLAHAASRTVWLGAEAALEGASGDFEYGKGSATLRMIVTPERRWALAVEAAGGTSRGDVPVQGRFYLGGPATLRGYSGGVISGAAFWRARAEVGNAFPAARLTAFTDLGWAGDRAALSSAKPLLGAGVGASFLDGLIRLDLARAMRGPTGWRFDIYFDGRL